MKEEIMKTFGFEKEVNLVKMGLCPFCKKEVKMEDFRNALSRQEFTISGLCQLCQDEFFGKD